MMMRCLVRRGCSPQGSVIGSILFILYMVEVFDILAISRNSPRGLILDNADIFAAYGVNCHCYADDMQVYGSVPATMADAESLHCPARSMDVEEQA